MCRMRKKNCNAFLNAFKEQQYTDFYSEHASVIPY